MGKISPALRARLAAQKKGMERGGICIDNKNLKRLRFRLLPVQDNEVPGATYTSFYCQTLDKKFKKGTTSPATFGVPCPVNDYLDRIYTTGSKEDKDFASNFLRRQTEYWLGVIDRADEGTPETPKVRILRGKQTVYQYIVDTMMDEEDGEDITDVKEGRDIIVKKSGAGLETEWKSDKCDKSPISEDKAMAKAWIALSKEFSVKSHFFPVNLDTLEAMYEGLTGESIPEKYLGPIKELIANGPTEGDAEDADGEVEVDEDEAEATEEAPKPAKSTKKKTAAKAPEPEPEEEEEDLTGRQCTFTDGDKNEITGTITGMDEDEDSKGNVLVVEADGDPEQPWSVPMTEITLVDEDAEADAEEEAEVEEEEAEEAEADAEEEAEEEEAEEETEPEEAPAPVTRKKTTKPAPVATTKKTVTKPAATKPTTKVATKPAATTSKVLPRKPGTSLKPKASAGIKQSMTGKKK